MIITTRFQTSRQDTEKRISIKEVPMQSVVRFIVTVIATLTVTATTHNAAASGDKTNINPTQTSENRPVTGDTLPEYSNISEHKTQQTNPYLRSDILLWTTTGLGVLHHTDHVLRGNHSGFPFTSRFNEFTFSLGIYPVLLGGYALDAGPNYWIMTESLAFAGLGLAHTLIEPPSHQHEPWAHGTNILGVDSAATGRGAQVLSVMLSVGIGAHLVSSIYDGVKCGFTWTRKERCTDQLSQQDVRFNIAPTDSGMKALVGWRW